MCFRYISIETLFLNTFFVIIYGRDLNLCLIGKKVLTIDLPIDQLAR